VPLGALQTPLRKSSGCLLADPDVEPGRVGSQFWGSPGPVQNERTPRRRLIIQAGNRRLLKQQRLTMPKGPCDET
jgi:hypothetical protein